jgi:2-polyprenyl-3-methyl-5-hydroxy-6-metoxy-1,4-benzoquinol methylase
MQELFEIPEDYEAMLKKGIGLTGNDKHFFIRGRLDLVEKKTSLEDRPKRILDFGCGTGATSENLRLRFPESEIVGSDLSEPALAYAREKIQNQNIRFIPLEKLQDEAEFDLISVKVDSITSVNTQLSGELLAKTNEIIALKTNIVSILKKDNASKAEIAKAKIMIASLNSQLTSLTADLEKAQAENKQLTAQNQDLTNQNLILEVNLLIEQAKVQKLTKDLEKYDKKKKTDV